MRTGGADPKGVLAAIDKLIDEKKPTGEALQEALFYKGSIYFRDDKAKAKAALLEAQKLAPNSETGQRINGILDRFFEEASKAGDGTPFKGTDSIGCRALFRAP